MVLAEFDSRQRPAGEPSALVKGGLLRGGLSAAQIAIVPEAEAVDFLFSKANTGDLLVINPAKIEPMMAEIMGRYRQAIVQGEPALNKP